MGFDNYYAMVDSYRRVATPNGKRSIVTLGSFTTSTDCLYQWDTGIVLRGANRYALAPEFTTLDEANLVDFRKEPTANDEMHPVAFCAQDILGKDNSELNVRVRLCQKHSGKSVVIQNTDIRGDGDDEDDESYFRNFNEEICPFMDTDYELEPESSTAAGLILSGMMHNHKMAKNVVKSSFMIKIRTSEDHLKFLSDPEDIEEQLRLDDLNDLITQNLSTLRAIPSFRCEIVGFEIAFRGDPSPDYYNHNYYNEDHLFDDEELKILLEGLRWC